MFWSLGACKVALTGKEVPALHNDPRFDCTRLNSDASYIIIIFIIVKINIAILLLKNRPFYSAPFTENSL